MDWSELYERVKMLAGGKDDEAYDALRAKVLPWADKDFRLRGGLVDDVVTDTCSEIVEKIDAAYGAKSFFGFALGHYRTARNRYWRRDAKTQPLGDGDDPPAPEPGSSTLDEEDHKILSECVGSLDERGRATVRDRFLADDPKTDAQIAKELGINENYVRQIRSRTLTKLRTCIEAKRAASNVAAVQRPGRAE